MSLLIVPAFTSPRFGTHSSAIRVTRHTRSDGDGIPAIQVPPKTSASPLIPRGGRRMKVGRLADGGFPPSPCQPKPGLPPVEHEGLSLPTQPPGNPRVRRLEGKVGRPGGGGVG